MRPEEILGHITAQAALETGLPEGLPVVAAAGDKQVEVLGAGAIDPGQAYITCGTYCGLLLVGDEYLEDPSMGCYLAAHPGRYHYEGYGVRRGFWTVSWFAHQFGCVAQKLMGEPGHQLRGGAGHHGGAGAYGLRRADAHPRLCPAQHR